MPTKFNLAEAKRDAERLASMMSMLMMDKRVPTTLYPAIQQLNNLIIKNRVNWNHYARLRAQLLRAPRATSPTDKD